MAGDDLRFDEPSRFAQVQALFGRRTAEGRWEPRNWAEEEKGGAPIAAAPLPGAVSQAWLNEHRAMTTSELAPV